MKKMKTIKRDTATRQHEDAGKSANRIWFLISAVLVSTLLNLACTPRAFEKPNVAAPSSPATAEDKLSDFQNELEKMRTANLQFIFVFRRTDGAAFNSEDKKFLKANLPFYNRLVRADDDRAIIVGSNYKFPPESLEALETRFKVEGSATQNLMP
jgi:hypothetical protein